jgi:hypothetical protein
MRLDFNRTERGFLRADFADRYGAKCSIQQSSLATEDAIWLGCDAGLHHHVTGSCLARMHLTRAQVAALLPALTHFVATGELPSESGIGDVLGNHVSLLAHAAEQGANAEIGPSDALEVAAQITSLRVDEARVAEIESKLAPLVKRARTIRESAATRQGLAMGLAAAHADIAVTVLELFPAAKGG